MNRNQLGTANLNERLQAALNPPEGWKFEIERFGVTFRAGDKVIQTRNNYDKEVFNGDIGVIREITTDPARVRVQFDGGRDVEYEPGELDEVQLAYAITIHKSQGSEFPVVVIPISSQHYIMLRRNLVYTGLTRGKKLVVLVGSRRAIEMAPRDGAPGARGAEAHKKCFWDERVVVRAGMDTLQFSPFLNANVDELAASFEAIRRVLDTIE